MRLLSDEHVVATTVVSNSFMLLGARGSKSALEGSMKGDKLGRGIPYSSDEARVWLSYEREDASDGGKSGEFPSLTSC